MSRSYESTGNIVYMVTTGNIVSIYERFTLGPEIISGN